MAKVEETRRRLRKIGKATIEKIRNNEVKAYFDLYRYCWGYKKDFDEFDRALSKLAEKHNLELFKE